MASRKRSSRLTALALSGVMCAVPAVTSIAGTMGDGKYFNDYSSYEEAEAAADELNKDLSREGNVLLKNDGTLPLTGDEWVSVFGAGSDSLISVREDSKNASGTIADSLQAAGFNVNPALVRYYGAQATEIGNETYEFNREVEESLKVYDGAAVVVFTRAAGEGSDTARVLQEEEDNLYGDEEAAFHHKALATGSWDEEGNFTYDAESGTEYKHYQQLTASEENLLKYVESKFDKVIVVLNTANALEMYNLQQDENINAILLMERPGETGHVAVGEILNGTVNPSGRLVDEWGVDFTADPTWYNFGNNMQTGSSNIIRNEAGELTGEGQTGPTDPGYYMVDYEEDIYLGYRYYETYYYETYLGNTAASAPEGASEEERIAAANAWYEQNVLYPFGFGLSYTDFVMNIQGVYTDAACTQALGETVDQSLFASAVDSPAQVETLYIPVEVTNTGDVTGKQVVEVYVTAPYTQGGVEKSYQTLAGFAKSSLLAPGETETVMVSIQVQDFASYDYANRSGLAETGGHSTSEIPSIGKKAGTEADSPNNLSNTHTWCDESTVASTWNMDLARKQGILVGDMAMYKGVNGWWGPGMDTHRSPFSGRNNEYYSQDGLQGGYIAAAVVSGAESRGLKVYIKHFALNDQETSRDGMNNNSFISEQAMRENNLKVFQMAMQEGGAVAAMCAFARVSGIPTAVNYDFLVKLADEQWGWNGVFLTDGYMGVASCTTGDYMVRTGCIQLALGGSTTVSGEWDASLRDGMGGVTVDGVQNDVQYYYIRQFAICLLSEEANSTANENGFTQVTMDEKAFEGAQAAEINETVALSDEVLGTSSAIYTVTEGELPEGVTLGSDGSLTGTPVQAGSYHFDVTAAIDQWVERSASCTLEVSSVFTTEGDALDSLTAGSAMRSAIVSETVSVDAGFSSVTYALTDGALPEGLTLNEDGTVTGTPTEAGTYDFTVEISASKQAENAGGPGGMPGGMPGGPGMAQETSTVYLYTGTIVVGE